MISCFYTAPLSIGCSLNKHRLHQIVDKIVMVSIYTGKLSDILASFQQPSTLSVNILKTSAV